MQRHATAPPFRPSPRRLIAGSASLADCVPLKSLHFPPLALFGQNAPVSTWGKAMLTPFPRIDAPDRARGRMGLTAILLHNVKQPGVVDSEWRIDSLMIRSALRYRP